MKFLTVDESHEAKNNFKYQNQANVTLKYSELFLGSNQ